MKPVTIMIIVSPFSSISSDWSQMDTVNYETYETDGVYDSMEQNAPVAKGLLFENKLYDNVTIVTNNVSSNN